MSNPNALVIEEFVEEENFEDLDQELDIIQNECLESVQADEGESYFYIFIEKEDSNILQENVVQTRTKSNNFKSKEAPEKENTKENKEETSKNQVVCN
jgi:hypothetical protein